MDKSLDDIIASNKPRRRTVRRGGARAQILGSKPAVSPAARARVASATVTPAAVVPASQAPADKIIVSNLPQDVNEMQIKELFASTVGPLRDVTLHYDNTGRSKGVAAVHFQRKGDGSKAYQQYNNRLIDGKRPMRIEIVVDPARPTAQSLVSRVAPAPVAAAAATVPRTASRPKRGRAKGRRGERPPKTAADLDAEMEDYTASNAPAAAVTAA